MHYLSLLSSSGTSDDLETLEQCKSVTSGHDRIGDKKKSNDLMKVKCWFEIVYASVCQSQDNNLDMFYQKGS